MSANRPSTSIAPYVVGVIGTLLLIFVLYLTMFTPKLKQAEALNAQTTQIQTTNNGLKSRMDLVQAQEDNLPVLEKSVADFHQSFPDQAAQKDLLETVTRSAEQTGVTLTNVSTTVPASIAAIGQAPNQAATPAVPVVDPKAAEPVSGDATSATTSGAGLAKAPAAAPLIAEPVAQVEVTVNAEGDRANLRAFLTKLEELKRPIKVATFEMHEQGESFSMSVVGNTFFTAPLVVPVPAPAG